ncbi:hypothetical protein G5I_06188 [Acromyrmex echinatior]|uniref:Uncharacterized protein n=1 Tax=Acromyrmex echinatior TaxID=103372 RepID=F4WKA4_ACREC|nr:hypothetical protein G5I_06188 [Acromyrmex echinatior]
MSSLRRTINQSMREGTSTRRHALSGPTTKSMKNVAHTNAMPASPMRYRTKYELRSISLEGNKVLPWTTRTTHSRDQAAVHKVLIIKETGLEAIPLLILIQEELYQQQQRDISPASGSAISDFGASLFIINPFAIGLWTECSLPLFCVKPISLDHARSSGSRPRHLDGERRGIGARWKYGAHIREARVRRRRRDAGGVREVSPGQRWRLKERRVDLVPARIRVTEPTPYSTPNRGDRFAHRYATLDTSNGDTRHGAAIRHHSDPVRVRRNK